MTTGFSKLTLQEAERQGKLIRNHAQRLARKGEARAWLIKHGFATPTGKMTKRYGGK